MSKKVKVTAIQIRYPDGTVKQLSVDDAKELHRELNELFGTSIPQYVPSMHPIIIKRDRWLRWRTIWRDSQRDTVSLPERRLEVPPAKSEVWCCTDGEEH